MTRTEERQLAAAAVTDNDAYAALYTRYYPFLLATARHLLRSTDDAEDLVQDLFLRIRPKLGQFEGGAALATWLHRALFNLHVRRCSSLAAKAKRVPVEEAPVLALVSRPNQSALWPSVARSVRRMSAGDRAGAWSLISGQTSGEFARASGLTTNAASLARWRARRKLAESLGMA